MRWIRVAAGVALALGCASEPGVPKGPAVPAIPEIRGNEPEVWRAHGEATLRAARLRAARVGRTLEGRARNVLVFIGDGMGVSTVTAARILAGQLRGDPGEEGWLAFEHLPHLALLKTYNTNQQVSDSAGTATAMFTGVKTRAGVINVDASAPRGVVAGTAQRLPNLFRQAEQRGLATGIVTTARLTHATPAAAYASVSERDWECDRDVPAEQAEAGAVDIARQFVELEAGDGFEVAFGGGRSKFLPEFAADPEYRQQGGGRGDGRDLVVEWLGAAPDREYVWSTDQLARWDPSRGGQILGLFEPSHMQWEALRGRDAAGEPSLAEMTRVALERLERHDTGWVLMVEAGRIDHGHHAGSAYLALHDTVALSEAVAAALERVDLEETLVIVTADHSHVLTLAGYPTRGNPILGLARGNDERGEPADTVLRDATGLPYTTLGYANGPGYPGASDSQPEGAKRFPHFPRAVAGVTAGRPDLFEVDTTAPTFLQESTVPLIAETHAGEDVPLYAAGPGAHLFFGVREQSYVYHVIREALGWQ